MFKVALFAYGSMKEGFRNHWRLEGQKKIGEAATLKRYGMHPSYSFRFPYAIETKEEFAISGELYEIQEALLEELDVFEGVPKHYYRQSIEVVCDGEIYTAYMYFRSKDNPSPCAQNIAIHVWTKAFEKAGDLLEQFHEQVQTASAENQLLRAGLGK